MMNDGPASKGSAEPSGPTDNIRLALPSFLIPVAAILLLSACSPPLPIVSADTSCERFRHISATDAQIKVFADNWDVMESYADQIVAFNIEYDKHCLPSEVVK